MQVPNVFQWERQIPQPTSSLPSATESQIISNLNFSIEDLLSKISKVTNDFQYTPTIQSQTSKNISQTKRQILSSENRETGEALKIVEHPKSYSSKASTNDYDFRISSQKLIEVAKSSQKPAARINYTSKTQNLDKPKHYSHRRMNVSATSIQQNSPQIRFNKINSLFDDQSIKEVAESTIFNQSGNGTYRQLQCSINQLKHSVLSPHQSKIPQAKLSDFQLGKEVGSGKFGDVYLCRHKATGTLFALKKIFKSVIQQYRMEAQLVLQLKILYALDHPNIVRLYTHFCDQYHIFLLMEYVQGGEFMSRQGKPEKYVAPVIGQVIDAVDYIHSRGIVHRDIKPENIVMSFESTAKLCDFGWAGLFDHKTMKTTFCGTLDYVSPEMKDKGQYSSKVDIWSIGVLTFQMLTGSAPFKNEIAHWKMRGGNRSTQWDWHIIYPPSLSGLAQSFMRNLLKENPDERASLRYCKSHFFIKKHQDFCLEYQELERLF